MTTSEDRGPALDRRHANRPGQRSLTWRLGTHPVFLRRMLDRLAHQEIADGEHAGDRPLAALTTRESSDPAIALLDAWACVADVLTFYQERIANEGFLRTAGERRSLLELARAVGYELHPAVSASTWLAFQVDDPPGEATVPARAQVLSIPAQDALPQTFETERETRAYATWNRLTPAPPVPQRQGVAAGEELLLTGTASGLVRGDVLLLVGSERENDPASDRWCLLTVRSVAIDAAQEVTRVAWSGDVARLPAVPRLFAFRRRAALFGHDAPDWLSLPARERFLPAGTTLGDFPEQWPGFDVHPSHLDLDAVYAEVLEGSWILLLDESGAQRQVQPLRVSQIQTAWRGDYTLRSQVTRIEGDTKLDPARFGLRGTVVFAESEELELARVVRPLEIGGDTIDLLRIEPEPRPGQALILTAGEDEAGRSLEPREVAFVQRVEKIPERPDCLRLALRDRLEHGYEPARVVIHGNVARATHGETVREVLGSGDAAKSHQRFVLRVPPLTHLATPEGGMASTLEVRVNDVLWQQAPSLYGLGPDSKSYIVRIGDDRVPVLIFGDGVRGARLPTGQENVAATYRSGGGSEGNVAAGSLALLQTRPLGVRSVTNPLPATGGVPRDNVDRARSRAPLSVRTLERLVALRDYETFTRAFPGIGKAQAAMLPTPGGRLLHLTVAGIDGATVRRDSDLHRSLQAAIGATGERGQKFEIASYRPREARIQATVHIESGRLPETVLARVEAALGETFGFAARNFGQGLAASEVVTAIQAVAGVVAVDLDTLCFAGEWLYGPRPLHPFLEAHRAHLAPDGPQPAELLLIHLEPGDLIPQEVHR